jgi:hypothetical protein
MGCEEEGGALIFTVRSSAWTTGRTRGAWTAGSMRGSACCDGALAEADMAATPRDGRRGGRVGACRRRNRSEAGRGPLGGRGVRARPSGTGAQGDGGRDSEGIPGAGRERAGGRGKVEADGWRPRHRTEAHPRALTAGHLLTEGTTCKRLQSEGGGARPGAARSGLSHAAAYPGPHPQHAWHGHLQELTARATSYRGPPVRDNEEQNGASNTSGACRCPPNAKRPRCDPVRPPGATRTPGSAGRRGKGVGF